MSKRKRRTSRIEPVRVTRDGSVLIITNWRNGVEHVVRVNLGDDSYRAAERIAILCREHIESVREARASSWRRVNESVRRLGGEAK